MFRVFLYQSQMKELQINYRVVLDSREYIFFFFSFFGNENYKCTKLQY